MNFQHLRTMAWLRWRLACNQINRMGWANRAILYLLIFLSFIVGFASFFVAIALGIWLLPSRWPD